MVLMRKNCIKRNDGIWNLVSSRERDLIEKWREQRMRDKTMNPCEEFWRISFTLATIKSFIHTLNIMVFIHILISTAAVFTFQVMKISYDINISLFVPPIVFPLAFSINSDYQRREKVLEDLAAFKSSGMSWYFCMREWKKPAELDWYWIDDVRKVVKSLLSLVREYLVTTNLERREIILRVIYSDFSEANELNEKLRASKLPSNAAIVSRSVFFVHQMSLAIERLRAVRDYRSPRSIRSFNKVIIIILMIILAPYFVHLGEISHNQWHPYHFAVILAFIFSTLQGVQDKLDDPFDGLGEDDINVETIDDFAPLLESTSQSPYKDSSRRSKASSYYDSNPEAILHPYINDSYAKSPKCSVGDSSSDESKDPVKSAPTSDKVHIISSFSVYASATRSKSDTTNKNSDQEQLLSKRFVEQTSSCPTESNYCVDNDNLAADYVFV